MPETEVHYVVRVEIVEVTKTVVRTGHPLVASSKAERQTTDMLNLSVNSPLMNEAIRKAMRHLEGELVVYRVGAAKDESRWEHEE